MKERRRTKAAPELCTTFDVRSDGDTQFLELRVATSEVRAVVAKVLVVGVELNLMPTSLSILRRTERPRTG
jgi:hypothetical protein